MGVLRQNACMGQIPPSPHGQPPPLYLFSPFLSHPPFPEVGPLDTGLKEHCKLLRSGAEPQQKANVVYLALQSDTSWHTHTSCHLICIVCTPHSEREDSTTCVNLYLHWLKIRLRVDNSTCIIFALHWFTAKSTYLVSAPGNPLYLSPERHHLDIYCRCRWEEFISAVYGKKCITQLIRFMHWPLQFIWYVICPYKQMQ